MVLGFYKTNLDIGLTAVMVSELLLKQYFSVLPFLSIKGTPPKISNGFRALSCLKLRRRLTNIYEKFVIRGPGLFVFTSISNA